MTLPTVSVVIVSRGRAEALKHCLLGVSQIQYPSFEVVVVADPEGIKAASEHGFADHLKRIDFDEANIAAARNLGISNSAGDIVAFLDDDAVPEPSWLHHLVAPFANARVAATGGFVRARNGISFQWKARKLDALGHASPIDIDEERATVLTPTSGTAIKTEGTNMAMRRDVLVSLGGFDPAYHYFLDETDVNMRLAAAGHSTALVPLAQVHHGFAASKHRRADRAPADLFDIGASWAVLQRKFVPQDRRKQHWRDVRKGERRRALSLMVSGHIEPRDVVRLMARLDQEYGQGIARHIGGGQVSAHAVTAFRPFPARIGPQTYLTSRASTARARRAEARARVKAGEVVTLLVLLPSGIFHHAGFHRDGYWQQWGGQFGKSVRSQPLVRFWRFASRARFERARIEAVRRLPGN